VLSHSSEHPPDLPTTYISKHSFFPQNYSIFKANYCKSKLQRRGRLSVNMESYRHGNASVLAFTLVPHCRIVFITMSDDYRFVGYRYNNQVTVIWLADDHLLLRDFGPSGIIFMVCVMLQLLPWQLC
jgi:hypothetical protein